MKWSRQRKQKEKQQSRSSSAGFSSSFFKLLPISWISKFRQTKNSNSSTRPPENHLASPDFRAFSSDHLSVSPAIFDAPRRHSCATADEVRFFDRSRGRDNLMTSARLDPDFPLLACRSCRLDSFSPPEKKEDLRRAASPPAPAEMEKTKIRRSRGRSLESFAVVKRSVDPQRDFRESMVEMIEKNRMGKAEELERLLACYLALNAEEYHEVIVKVFRQVWLDLDPEVVHSRRRREGP